MNEGQEVFTIGHSTHSLAEFMRLLRLHAIDVVADVRSTPQSRFNPHFCREAFEIALKQGGFRYVFLGRELGARTSDLSCYLDGKVQYSRLAKTALFQGGLDRIIRGKTNYRIALMCAEKEPLDCHRTLLVGRALVERGVPIVHIHADGKLESYEDSMSRLLHLTGVPKQDMFRSKEELLNEALARQEQNVAYVNESLVPSSVNEDAL